MTATESASTNLTGPRVGHLVSLKNLGGIERSFSQFLAQYGDAYDHHVLKQTDRVHPIVASSLATFDSTRIHSIKGPCGLKIPRLLSGLRERYQRRLLRVLDLKAILVWGKIVDHPLVFPDHLSLIHYERGSAWLADERENVHSYLNRINGVACNSRAALRMLQLKWGVAPSLPARIIHNTIKLPRQYSHHPEGRFRLGFAGRLIALKAPMIALETFAELKIRCPHAELWIAGEGPQLAVLHKLTQRWGLQESVRFCGLVDDMTTFYMELDAFICPSWREPFGNVALEALAHGVPTLVGCVDGLAEQILDGENGAVLSPRRERGELGQYGKECLMGPNEVYSPEKDAVVQAGIIDPEEAAAILSTWAESPSLRRLMGENARIRIGRDFNLDDYGHKLLEFISEVVSKNRC